MTDIQLSYFLVYWIITDGATKLECLVALHEISNHINELWGTDEGAGSGKQRAARSVRSPISVKTHSKSSSSGRVASRMAGGRRQHQADKKDITDPVNSRCRNVENFFKGCYYTKGSLGTQVLSATYDEDDQLILQLKPLTYKTGLIHSLYLLFYLLHSLCTIWNSY